MNSSRHPASATGADSSAPRRLGRIVAFDGFRGVMILIVVVGHMSLLIPGHGLLLLPGTTVGLDGFFVLSGFLITALLLKEQRGTGSIKLGGFYQRRALRLLPALIGLLLAHALYAYLTDLPGGVERSSLVSVLFYFSNYKLALGHPQLFLGGAPFADGMRHLWSLAVEEQFYLVWPLVVVLFLGGRRSLRTVVIVLVTAIAAITIYRWHGWNGPRSYYGLFVRTDYRADAMLWGALLAHLWVRYREPTRWVRLAAWPAVVFLAYWMAFVPETRPYLYKGGLTLIDFASAILILAVLQGQWVGARVFTWRPIVLLGTVSYGVYLWHLPVYSVVARYGTNWPWPVRVTLALLLTTSFALLSWFLLERPALRQKQRIEPVTTESPPVTLGDATRFSRDARPGATTFRAATNDEPDTSGR